MVQELEAKPFASSLETWEWDFEDSYGSRRARLRARGGFPATVPALIAKLPVALDPSLISELEYATNQLVRFDSDQALVAPFAAILLRSESASSSEVEQLTASARQIALAELVRNPTPNASLIVDNVAAMKAATSLAADASAESLMLMHAALMSNSRPEIAGKFRDRPVWIGGLSPHAAKFVGPRPERIAPGLEDLHEFTKRLDIPRLAQIAIAHAQFETIHPFEDGNGRTGRALVQTLLRKFEITKTTSVPLSAGILADTKGYFQALDAYRAGEVTPIIEVFISATLSATWLGNQLIEDLSRVTEQHEAICTDRVDSVSRRLIRILAECPALDSALVQRLLGVSAKSALTGLTRLEQLGILTRAGTQRRSMTWICNDVIQALELFADRARRG